jgi:hypothetical protein
LDKRLGFKKPAAEQVPFETFAGEFLETYFKPNKKSYKGDAVT